MKKLGSSGQRISTALGSSRQRITMVRGGSPKDVVRKGFEELGGREALWVRSRDTEMSRLRLYHSKRKSASQRNDEHGSCFGHGCG